MSTPPVMSLIDEIVAELELACEEAALVSLGRTTIRRLLSERAELKRDAERYRYLRNESVNADGDTVMAAKIDAVGDQISNWFFGTGLDSAIDAAMTQ